MNLLKGGIMNNNNYKVIELHSCEHCGKIVRDEWNYCPFCMAGLDEFTCKVCGKKIKADWRYCPHCKNDLNRIIKRKIVQKINSSNRNLSSSTL